ncbi:hypothetical protein WAE61_02135 [Comamonadaceae bacterium PP-2]
MGVVLLELRMPRQAGGIGLVISRGLPVDGRLQRSEIGSRFGKANGLHAGDAGQGGEQHNGCNALRVHRWASMHLA